MKSAEATIERNILLAGASRGIGLGLAKWFAEHGWNVVATERVGGSGLKVAAAAAGGRISVERLDINDKKLVQALRSQLSNQLFDVIFVVAGVRDKDPSKPIHEVSADEAARLFITNAYSPIFFAETFFDRLKPGGTLAIMSSRLGSVTLVPTFEGWEAYRASKAALNILAHCFHQRHSSEGRTILLIHPGWVKTDLGGEDATVDVATSVDRIRGTLSEWQGTGKFVFLDDECNVLPW